MKETLWGPYLSLKDKDPIIESHFMTIIGVMEERIVRAENARIKIAKTIYPNVVLRIGHLRYQNETELVSTTFYREDEEIKASAYVL